MTNKTIAEATCPCGRRKVVNIRTQKARPDRLYLKCGHADAGGCGSEIFERADDHGLILSSFKVTRWRDDDWKKAITGEGSKPVPVTEIPDDDEPENPVTDDPVTDRKSIWEREL